MSTFDTLRRLGNDNQVASVTKLRIRQSLDSQIPLVVEVSALKDNKIDLENRDHKSEFDDTRRGDDNTATRRTFFGAAGTVAMIGGLAAGYGTLGYCALRFLMPNSTDENLDWQFVATLESLTNLSSYEFIASSGAKIVIARATDVSDTGFLALSSVCPHLGCQVFWESAKNRFFCPCHNGVFDASGEATAGPPADAQQSLTQYPTRIQSGSLYVKAPLRTVTDSPKGSF